MFKGEYLKELRELIGASRVDVAAAINCHPTAIKVWEEGKREPSMGIVKMLVDYFNPHLRFYRKKVTVSDFWEEPSP